MISENHKKRCRLYLISPPKFDPEDFAEQLEEALDGGNVGAFQLRMKETEDKNIIKATKLLLPICRIKGVAFIMNDNLEIAAKVGADGVHIGYDDGMAEKNFIHDLRNKVDKDFIIGTSCYDSRHLAMTAAEQGADYVSFGAFFPTKTKISPGKPKPEILEWWSTYTTVPCVAIGGIKAKNCGALVRSGADFIAAISAIWEHKEGPKFAVEEMCRAIESAATQSDVAKSIVNC